MVLAQIFINPNIKRAHLHTPMSAPMNSHRPFLLTIIRIIPSFTVSQATTPRQLNLYSTFIRNRRLECIIRSQVLPPRTLI